MTDRVGTEMREGFVCVQNNSFGVCERERERESVCVFRSVSVNLGERVCVSVCLGMCV